MLPQKLLDRIRNFNSHSEKIDKNEFFDDFNENKIHEPNEQPQLLKA